MDSKDVIAQMIELLGGPVRAARELGVGRYQVVQQWLRTGRVPAEYCPLIERATGGQVRCEDLRPDVEWSVLRAAPSDTAIVAA